MKPAFVVILSGALTFGIPLLIAIWEVAALRRDARGGWRPDGSPPPEPPAPPMDSPPAQRPLPACLVPTRHPAIAAQRTLEPV